MSGATPSTGNKASSNRGSELAAKGVEPGKEHLDPSFTPGEKLVDQTPEQRGYYQTHLADGEPRTYTLHDGKTVEVYVYTDAQTGAKFVDYTGTRRDWAVMAMEKDGVPSYEVVAEYAKSRPYDRSVMPLDEFNAYVDDFVQKDVTHYESGSPFDPGTTKPRAGLEDWDKSSTSEAIWDRKVDKARDQQAVKYQEQVSGMKVVDGQQPEVRVPVRDANGELVLDKNGKPLTVDYDGKTVRDTGEVDAQGNPITQEVYLEAKKGHAWLDEAMRTGKGNKNWVDTRVNQLKAQVNALPEGTKLEIHVSTPEGAAGYKALVKDMIRQDSAFKKIEVVYTPMK